MSTVPTSLSSVTPRGICTKGASLTSVGISSWPSFSLSPSWKHGRCFRGPKTIPEHPRWRWAWARAVLRGQAGRQGRGQSLEFSGCVQLAHLPLSAVFRIGIAVASPDDLDRRQESVQASCKHRLQTHRRPQYHPCLSACTLSSAVSSTRQKIVATPMSFGQSKVPYKWQWGPARAQGTHFASAALPRYADAAQACVTCSQQQGLLDEVHSHHSCHGEGPLQAH